MKLNHISQELVQIANGIDNQEQPSLSLTTFRIKRILAAIGQREFAAPLGQVLAQLQEWLIAKYAIDAAYRSFADRVRGPWRDSLYEHWSEHAEDERKHAYNIAMKIVALGGDPMITVIQIPPCPPNLAGFYTVLANLELRAIENAHTTIQLAGDDAPLKLLADEIMYLDAHHLDDLKRMFETVDLD